MSEKETIFSSSVKWKGIANFKSLYKFCYDWLIEETGLDYITEKKYNEKLSGNKKELIIEWEGPKKLTDYFRLIVKVKFEISDLENVELNEGGKKISTNQGTFKIIVKGILERDYQGKFERDAFRKFLRSVYEKWVITSRVDQFEGKVFGDCDEFLSQTKAFLSMEGQH